MKQNITVIPRLGNSVKDKLFLPAIYDGVKVTFNTFLTMSLTSMLWILLSILKNSPQTLQAGIVVCTDSHTEQMTALPVWRVLCVLLPVLLTVFSLKRQKEMTIKMKRCQVFS